MVSYLLAFTILVAQTIAWSINGHLYVTAIAEKVLEERAPEVLKKAEAMLEVMEEYDAEWVYREVNHTFVESSTFADDYKYRGEAWQGPYHFV